MTYILQYPRREIEVPVRLQTGMKGYFRVQTKNLETGHVRFDSGWFPNKILDSGKNNLATVTSWLTDCQVGTDSTLPNASQTALLGFVAGTDQIETTLKGANGVAPYFGWVRKTFRFAQGATTGNLSEVGVGWDKVQGDNLVTRALIIDPITQQPTTVTPLPDEVLDVTYEFRYYAPENDVIGPQVTLNGVVYDTVTRAAIATSSIWYDWIGSKIEQYSPYTTSWQAWTGELGTVVQNPSGTPYAADNANHYTLAYQNNSYEVGIGANIGSSGWNAVGGIRSISIQTTAGGYQTRFGATVGDATIPKDANYTMVMRWMLSWTERP